MKVSPMSAPGRNDAGGKRTVPSMASRLARALGVWTLMWVAAVGLAIWLATTHEVDELLDDTLASSAALLVATLSGHDDSDRAQVPDPSVERFAWQLVDAQGLVLLRSPRAPQTAWHDDGRAGFHTVPGWRLFALPTGRDGQMLYAAQTLSERREARLDVGLAASAAALAMGLLGHGWLRTRLRQELQPLQRLSERLQHWQPGEAVQPLGAPERMELASFHRALEALADRLAARLATERAFAAHAAHALRTPLAGIDAQLAVAAREATGPLVERLQRVREAAARLKPVMSALLALFRSADGAAALQREVLDAHTLRSRLPSMPLDVRPAGSGSVHADPDLLLAALVNLLDNAARAGARHAVLSVTDGVLTLHDDGPGVTPAQRGALQQVLQAAARTPDTGGASGPPLGLGLLLADRVARAHGGRLSLPDVEHGFAARLTLGAACLCPADTASPAVPQPEPPPA